MLEMMFDKCAVKIDDAPKTLPNGMVLPDRSIRAPDQPHTTAVVIAVGPGKPDKDGNLIPIDHIKAGDRVIIEPKHGSGIDVDGVGMTIIPADNLIALVTED